MNYFELQKYKTNYFASCPLYLENLLLDEIHSLEIKNTNVVRGGVEFESLNEKVIELILKSRIASRIFKKYYSFYIKNEKEFSTALRDVKWRDIFEADLRFKVMSHVGGDIRDFSRAFQNTLYLSQLVKDSIVDHFKKFDNYRPTVDVRHPEATIYIHITSENTNLGKRLKVDVLMDLCGDPISDRGLRPLGRSVTAPLRENLAAGIIKLLDWKPKEERLVDLMCGSGTILAEAYMMAKNIPPSFKRVQLFLNTQDQIFAFQNLWWFQSDKQLMKSFQSLMIQIEKQLKMTIPMDYPLRGLDINADAIYATKSLIESMNAQNEIEVMKADATTYDTSIDQKELLFCNPPYGVRLDKDDPELGDLYYDLGEQWKNYCKGSRAFIFSANTTYLKRVSLKPSKKWDLFNGQLPAKLVEYHLY